MTFSSFLNELWSEPAIKWTLYCAILGFVFYWLFCAIFETLDRQRVITAAKKWAENKERRNQRAAARDLWDSVNQLKRGQKQQRHTFTDREKGQ